MALRIKKFFANYKTEIILFSAAFGVRFIYALAAQFFSSSHVFISFLDAAVFLREAKNILEHGVMSQAIYPPYLPDPLRTPLYLYFLAALLALKLPLFGIVTVQNILAGLSAVMIYRLGKMIFETDFAGLLAAAIFAFEPASIYWNNMLMSDNLFAFLLLCAIYLFAQKRFYAFAFVLGFATLTRPLALYLAPVFLAMFLWMNYKGGARQIMKKIVIAAVIFTAVIAPWMGRNKILFNTYELSSVGWLNLYIFSFQEFARSQGFSLPMPEVPADYYSGPYEDGKVLYNYEFVNVPFYKQHILEVLKNYPLSYAVFHAASVIKSFGNHDYPYIANYVILAKAPGVNPRLLNVFVYLGQAFWIVVYIFSALGIVMAKNKAWAVFFLALIITNNFLLGYNGVISSGGRYNLPLAPLILLLGAYGLRQALNIKNQRQRA